MFDKNLERTELQRKYMLGKPEIIAEFTGVWESHSYLFVGKNETTTSTPTDFFDFTSIRDFKIIMDSSLSEPVVLRAIDERHPRTGERILQIDLRDYFSEEILTINAGEKAVISSNHLGSILNAPMFDVYFRLNSLTEDDPAEDEEFEFILIGRRN